MRSFLIIFLIFQLNSLGYAQKICIHTNTPHVIGDKSETGPSVLTLKAFSIEEDSIYWYESLNSTVPFFKGNLFKKYFNKTTTYYVAAKGEDCFSHKVPVSASVDKYPLIMPDYLWVDQTQSTGATQGLAVAIDSKDNVYSFGLFSDNEADLNGIKVGKNTIDGYGYNNFIAKYDTSGKVTLAFPGIAGKIDFMDNQSIKVDHEGSIYLGGNISGGISLGSIDFPFTDTYDFFIIKFDSMGKELWAKKFYTYSYQNGSTSFCIDSENNVVFKGSFEGTTIIDSVTLYTQFANNRAAFFGKFDKNGKLVFVKTFNTELDYKNTIIADNEDNIIISGIFQEQIDFTDTTFACPPLDYNTYIVKYNKLGEFAWAKLLPKTHTSGIAADSSGNIFISGDFITANALKEQSFSEVGDIFLVKFASDGKFIWLRQFYCPRNVLVTGFSADKNGNSLITGYYQEYLNFDGFHFNPHNRYDFFSFVTSYDSDGNFNWVKDMDQLWFQEAVYDSKNNAYTIGSFEDSVRMDNLFLYSTSRSPVFSNYSYILGKIGFKLKADFDISDNCSDINFINKSSSAFGNSIANYFWDFGDGITSTEKSPSHTFQSDQNVSLTITDDKGDSSTITKYVNSVYSPVVTTKEVTYTSILFEFPMIQSIQAVELEQFLSDSTFKLIGKFEPGSTFIMENLIPNTTYRFLVSAIDINSRQKCSFDLFIITENITSLQEENGVKINVFPNPTSGLIKFNSDKLINKIKIIDLNGIVYKNINNVISQEVIVDLIDLPNGVYFICLENKETFIHQKIIKK